MKKLSKVSLLISLATLTLLFLAGCGQQGDPAGDILGTWYTGGGGGTYSFHEDKTFTLQSYSTGRKLVTFRGTYDIEGGQKLAIQIDKFSTAFGVKTITKDHITLVKESDKSEILFDRYQMKNKGLAGKWNVEGVALDKMSEDAKDVTLDGALEFLDDCTAKYVPGDGSKSYQGKIYFKDENNITVQLANEDESMSIIFIAQITKLSDAACELNIGYQDRFVQLSRVNP